MLAAGDHLCRPCCVTVLFFYRAGLAVVADGCRAGSQIHITIPVAIQVATMVTPNVP